MRKLVALASVAAAFGLTGAASAQFVVMPNSTADTLMTFDPFDGTLLNAALVSDAAGFPYDFNTPKAAIQVEDEIWVSDQVGDVITRFDMTGNYLGTVSGGMDNIRGIAYINGVVYVANAGTNNGAPGDALVMFNADGVNLGNILDVGDPFDVLEYNGELLVADIQGESIRRHAYDGTFLGVFHDSDGLTGIDFPQQLARLGSNVMAAGFSPPAGIYEYDATGAQVNFYNVGSGLRGVYELGNGNILWSDAGGVHVFDRGTGLSTTVAAAGGQYFSLIGGGTACPADWDGDEVVNSGDISAFLTAWIASVQAGDTAGDFDGSGQTNSGDISSFLTAWIDAVTNGC